MSSRKSLRPRTRIVGRPTTSWHLASCDATSLPYCRSLCELLLLLLAVLLVVLLAAPPALGGGGEKGSPTVDAVGSDVAAAGVCWVTLVERDAWHVDKMKKCRKLQSAIRSSRTRRRPPSCTQTVFCTSSDIYTITMMKPCRSAAGAVQQFQRCGSHETPPLFSRLLSVNFLTPKNGQKPKQVRSAAGKN